MLSERDQSETNNAIRVLFRYCYATQVRSRILSPRLKPFILFYYYYFFFWLSLLRRALLVPLGGCLGQKEVRSGRWERKKQESFFLPSLAIIIIILLYYLYYYYYYYYYYYIWKANASFCLWPWVLHRCIWIRNKREWCKRTRGTDLIKNEFKTECINSKRTKPLNMRRSLLEWSLLSKLIQNSVDYRRAFQPVAISAMARRLSLAMPYLSVFMISVYFLSDYIRGYSRQRFFQWYSIGWYKDFKWWMLSKISRK